jgi:hypothetical protein
MNALLENFKLSGLDEERQSLLEIMMDILNNQEDLDPEFVKVVDKHFWDLIDTKILD